MAHSETVSGIFKEIELLISRRGTKYYRITLQLDDLSASKFQIWEKDYDCYLEFFQNGMSRIHKVMLKSLMITEKRDQLLVDIIQEWLFNKRVSVSYIHYGKNMQSVVAFDLDQSAQNSTIS